METKSIFDCDSPPIAQCAEVPTRVLVTYEDLFAFDDATPNDEIDSAPISVSISVSNVNGKRNVKRIAADVADDMSSLDLSNGMNKKRKHNAFNKTDISNGTARRTVDKNIKTDEYTLLKEIGCGTYGRVYKARLNDTNQIIAIKRLKCKLNTLNTESNLNFIKREYENLLELQDCINVVQLLKGHEHMLSKNDLQLDLLFEYCPHDLRKIILNKGINFHLSEIKAFLRQMLLGLKEMHNKSIMHRDFKTENILLTVDGVVKIADFGLSRKISDPSATFGKGKYTPNVVTQWYRAPEILLGDMYYTESVDMWSMGCVMGEFWVRNAILQGENQIGQLKLISRLCGSLKPETWPNIVNLNAYQQIKSFPNDSRKTRTFLNDKTPKVSDDHVNDFFDKLLVINPEKRFTVHRALNDHFFYTHPLPSKNLKQFMDRFIQTHAFQ